MKAITISENTEPLALIEKEKPTVGTGECLVKMQSVALNRRDQWIREGMYPNIRLGATLGSDGCGVVVEGSEEWLGKEVIINPNIDWGDNLEVQSSQYSVLGMPIDGTLAEYIKVPEHRIHKKPTHLTAQQAVALPLAGLTAYRATITKAQASKGKKILISGIGGGVSQMALHFAVAVGAEVYVTSGADWKIEKAVAHGAKAGVNYKNDNWKKELAQFGTFDAIVDSAGGNNLNQYLKVIKPAGKIVMYGSTTGHPEKLDVFRLFWSQAQIMGSTMGNDNEFIEMLSFIAQHNIIPTIDQVYSFDDYINAFNRFTSKEHYGKIVLNITN